MQVNRSGVTRLVVELDRYVVKVPRPFGVYKHFVRGWLANRSEWKQRHRPDVEPAVLTVFHMALVMRRAFEVGSWDPDTAEWEGLRSDGREGRDEMKGSSWGFFPEGWRLIDYDRAWTHPRGIVGGLYYWRQERLARKWSKL